MPLIQSKASSSKPIKRSTSSPKCTFRSAPSSNSKTNQVNPCHSYHNLPPTERSAQEVFWWIGLYTYIYTKISILHIFNDLLGRKHVALCHWWHNCNDQVGFTVKRPPLSNSQGSNVLAWSILFLPGFCTSICFYHVQDCWCTHLQGACCHSYGSYDSLQRISHM